MRPSIAIAIGIAVVAAARSAAGSTIGVYSTADATVCDLTVTPSAPVTWYIVARLHGDGAIAGITGAEFRQAGVPAGWFVNAVPNSAANVSLGHPLGDGANIAFPGCEGAFTPAVLLYTVSGFTTSAPSNLTFQIDRHTTPSNPSFRCPLLVLCDAPFFTTICVSAGCMRVNSTQPSCCPLAVQSTDWSAVKALYER